MYKKKGVLMLWQPRNGTTTVVNLYGFIVRWYNETTVYFHTRNSVYNSLDTKTDSYGLAKTALDD